MKNSILFITLSLFILSCNNQPTPNEISDHQEPEVITKNELSEISTTKIIKDSTRQEITTVDSITTEPLAINKINSSILIDFKEIGEQIINIEDEAVIAEPIIEDLINTPNHSPWNSILKSNVSSSGKVNYVGMKSKLSEIESYISNLESLSNQSTWSKNEKLAYWINLYNAATVRLIVQNYPTSSITTINGGKPWDKKIVTISGKSFSLNQIENDIIRPKFKEPRIHFAVNCAAVSCPKIMNSAFTADKLNYQLTKQAKAFVNGTKNSLTNKSIQISKIFEWYAVDFGSSVIDYLNKYSTTEINSTATITYKDYNWDLNK